MLEETTRTLQDPSGKTLYEAWKARVDRDKKSGQQSGQFNDSGAANQSLADTRIGSGSDHTVFLNFIGMPVLGLGFVGDYGVYHSVFDNFAWFKKFGDPTFIYEQQMARVFGIEMLHMANADVLPYDDVLYGHEIENYLIKASGRAEKAFRGDAPDFTRVMIAARRSASPVSWLRSGSCCSLSFPPLLDAGQPIRSPLRTGANGELGPGYPSDPY